MPRPAAGAERWVGGGVDRLGNRSQVSSKNTKQLRPLGRKGNVFYRRLFLDLDFKLVHRFLADFKEL